MEKQKFREFLLTKGLKQTKEREEIINELMNTKGHFDPDELFLRLKNKGSKVSRASVYRTIPILIESGFIEQVEKTDRHAHYEKVSEKQHHDHMICTKCGKVIEFYSPTLEMLQEELCQKEGFKGIKHTLEILGHCKKCSQ
ncbi:MAG: transcriptional repressor [Thermodesulfovibrionales bacterium]|nr:transcriptional repressor [Thermodesulfovibrionales bacterium]